MRFIFLLFAVAVQPLWLLGSAWLGDTLKKITYEEYIAQYSKVAVKHMMEYKIPASITLAQGLLESGAGNSELAREANNHFGIKCHKEWQGDTYLKDDDAKDDCFRKYGNAEESFRDHALFLTTRSRYASLFELEPTDYKGWSYGLKAAGYATNPAYAERLISLIERYELYKFDESGKKRKAKAGRIQRHPAIAPVTGKEPVGTGVLGQHEIRMNNGVKYVVVQPGEQLQTLADAIGIRPWMLRDYNDLAKTDTVKEGDIIYIQSKKRKGAAAKHTVKEHETLHAISQQYGLQLQQLLKFNNLDPGAPATPGMEIHLRKP